MITKKDIVEVVKKKNKKMGKEAFEELDQKIETFVDSLIDVAVRNAEMSGRVLLKKEDFSF
jgi:histone H3/H4